MNEDSGTNSSFSRMERQLGVRKASVRSKGLEAIKKFLEMRDYTKKKERV